MRLWTVHPKYLDAKGLVALWREALLAQKVLKGATRGYRSHPQLIRFKAAPSPKRAIASYLKIICDEADARGYKFTRSKIGRNRCKGRLKETRGQLKYEWERLKRKLRARDPSRWARSRKIKRPAPHPLFRMIRGGVRAWEKR